MLCPGPFSQIVQSRLGIKTLLHAHCGNGFTGESAALPAVVETFFFAAGFDLTFPAPKWFSHIGTAFAVYRFFAGTGIAAYTAP